MSKRVLFLFNPRSGKGKIKENLADIIDVMVKAGYEVTVYTTQSAGDAVQKARTEAGNYDRIICSGGDGTLDEVVTGVMALAFRCRSVIFLPEVPMILVIPWGSDQIWYRQRILLRRESLSLVM